MLLDSIGCPIIPFHWTSEVIRNLPWRAMAATAISLLLELRAAVCGDPEVVNLSGSSWESRCDQGHSRRWILMSSWSSLKSAAEAFLRVDGTLEIH